MAKVQKAAVRHYSLINKTWGEVKLVTPTGLQAIEAVKILWRSEGLVWEHWTMNIVSGNRHTWIRNGMFAINPNRDGQGWSEIVHDVAHLIHFRKNRKRGRKPRPHNFDQAKIERRLQQLVINKLAK